MVDPATGALTPAGSWLEGTGIYASVTVHPSGKFIYVWGMYHVSGFAFDAATGGLTVMAGGPCEVG